MLSQSIGASRSTFQSRGHDRQVPFRVCHQERSVVKIPIFEFKLTGRLFADELYVNLFLIVYRRFARPHDVLTKLIERFDFVAGRLKTDPLLSRFAQMKFVSSVLIPAGC